MFKPRGDLVKDKLVNYYFVMRQVENQSEKKLVLVNAVVEFAWSWILSEDLLK